VLRDSFTLFRPRSPWCTAAQRSVVYHARGGADLANQINVERLLKARQKAGLS